MATLAAGAALLVSLIIGRASIAFGPRLGLVDKPDEYLKPHQGHPVPLGGLGVLVGLHVGLGLLGVFDWGLLAGTVLVWLVGVFDDRIGVGRTWRLVTAAMAGVVIAVSQDPIPGLLVVLAATALAVLTVNAINLLDGLDVLAGSVGAMSALGLAVLIGLRGHDQAFVGVLLASALVGFLVWNLPPARVFLGDNGAYVVGVALAWIVLRASPDLMSGLVAVAVIGVPILDLGVTVVRRARRRTPLFEGDREHSYDLLHASGLSVIWVAVLLSGVQAVWATAVIAVSEFYGDQVAVVFALALAAVVVGWGGLRSPRQEDATSPPRP